MKKRMLLIILSMLLVISAFPMSAYASDSYSVTISGDLVQSDAKELLIMINNERIDNGLNTLTWDNSLEDYITDRAAELSLFYSFTRPDGTDGLEWDHGYGYSVEDYFEEMMYDSYLITDPDLTSYCGGVFITESGTPFYALIGGYKQVGDTSSIYGDKKYDFPLNVSDNYMDYYGELLSEDFVQQDELDLKKGSDYYFFVYNRNKKIKDYDFYVNIYQYYTKSSNTKVATINSKGVIKAKRAGHAELTIKMGKSSDLYFSKEIVVRPTKVKGVKVTSPKKKSLKVSWKKIAGADGYQIYRSTSKNGTYKLAKTIKSGSTTTWTNKSLKSGKKYYYKVRAYVKFNGKKYAGPYSVKVSKKTK